MIIHLGYVFAITTQIAVYYDVVYCTLHDDVIRPVFTFALITEHIHVLNLLSEYVICILQKFFIATYKIKCLKAKFAKTASIKSSTSTRSFVWDRSISVSAEATASG